jgi:hypothetical protein
MKKVILPTPKRTKSNSFSDADRLVSDTPSDSADDNHNNCSVTIYYVISNLNFSFC